MRGVFMKRMIRAQLLAGCALLAPTVFVGTPALAQDTPTPTPAAPPSAGPAPAKGAPTDSGYVPDIVVVGTRADAATLQFRSSQPISVLSEEDLRHTAVHNVAEALGL